MTHALEVRDLRYRYPDGTDALRGVAFTVGAGERVGIIGPNGAGKSTLLLHFNGLLPEGRAEGEHIRVEGVALAPSTLADVRRRVGLLFQDPNDQLFCPTVYDDVAFGPQQLGLSAPEVRSRVTDALAQVGLNGFEKRMPHHLSSGEKRRVCLAGVLACGPSLLALDEPSNSLDPKGRRELIALLRRIPLAQVIATHDLELVVELCQRVVLLANGLIVAEGPTRDVLSDEKLMLAHDLECPHILRHTHPHA